MSNQIAKRSILAGKEDGKKKDDPLYRKLKKIDAGKGETAKVKNPFTGREVSVYIDRTGTTDEKVAAVMVSPTATRDQKDFMISQWLFERGLESASFLADLYRYKGEHTKETRAFKSQMRFDYEVIVKSLETFYRTTSALMFHEMFPDLELETIKTSYLKYVAEQNEKGQPIVLSDFLPVGRDNSGVKLALLQNILQMSIEADLLTKKVEAVTKSRMAEKGWGIYIDSKGKPYSVNDSDILDIVKEDKERMEKIKNEELYGRATKPGDDEAKVS
jgi:hypothetical protein